MWNRSQKTQYGSKNRRGRAAKGRRSNTTAVAISPKYKFRQKGGSRVSRRYSRKRERKKSTIGCLIQILGLSLLCEDRKEKRGKQFCHRNRTNSGGQDGEALKGEGGRNWMKNQKNSGNLFRKIVNGRCLSLQWDPEVRKTYPPGRGALRVRGNDWSPACQEWAGSDSGKTERKMLARRIRVLICRRDRNGLSEQMCKNEKRGAGSIQTGRS